MTTQVAFGHKGKWHVNCRHLSGSFGKIILRIDGVEIPSAKSIHQARHCLFRAEEPLRSTTQVVRHQRLDPHYLEDEEGLRQSINIGLSTILNDEVLSGRVHLNQTSIAGFSQGEGTLVTIFFLFLTLPIG